MFRSRMLFWLVALGSAAALVWVWLRRRSEATLPASPAPFATLDPPNGQMNFSPATTTPAALPTPAAQAGSVPAAGPRRIVTRVHRGAPPAQRTAEPGVAEEAGAVPAEPVVLLTTPVPEAPAAEPAPEPVAEAAAEPEAPAAESAPEPVAEAAAEPEAPAAEPAPEPVAEAAAEPEVGEADDVEAGEAGEEPVPATGAMTTTPCNINSASLDELAALPGISRTVARRIIARRQEQGPFKSIEGLTNISGIGPQKLKDLAHLITVE